MEKLGKSEYFVEYEKEFNTIIRKLNSIAYSDEIDEEQLENLEGDIYITNIQFEEDIDKCKK